MPGSTNDCRCLKSLVCALAFLLALTVMFGLAGQVALSHAKDEAADYRAMLLRERDARWRDAVNRHTDALAKDSGKFQAFVEGRPPEIKDEYKDRLIGVHRRLVGRLCRHQQATPAPVSLAQPTPAPSAAAEPDAAPAKGRVMTAKHREIDKANTDNFEALQAWVRQHMLAHHALSI